MVGYLFMKFNILGLYVTPCNSVFYLKHQSLINLVE